jgi:hypothetical protein
MHRDLLAVAAQRLAGPEPEDGAGPAPVVQREVHFGEGLRAALRIHAILLGVGRHRPFADLPAGVAGAAGAVDRLFRAQGANGTQDVDFTIAQVTVAEADRRLHGDQAQELQEVILQHVLERSDAVVIAGSPLERQRFVPDDVHLGDMGTVPDRLQDAVGEPRPQDVLDGRHRQEVVDAEDRLLGIEAGQKAVELNRSTQVLAERLLQHDDAAGSRARTMQGRHGPGEHGRWKHQIGRQRLGALDHRVHAGRVCHVCLMVARGGGHGMLCRRRRTGDDGETAPTTAPDPTGLPLRARRRC